MSKPIRRVPTGVPRLDYLLNGGFFEGGLYIIQGQPGMGKTILANQCCFFRAQNKETAVYISLLAESTGRMISYLSNLNFVDQSAVNNSVHYVNGYQELKEHGFSGFKTFLSQLIKEYKAQLLVVDGLDILSGAAESDTQYREFLHALSAQATLMKCTVLLLMPTGKETEQACMEHALTDGVIDIREWRSGARSVREIQILKFRGSHYLKGGHEIDITADGFIIHPRTEVQFGKPSVGSYEEKRTRMGFGILEFDRMLHGGLLSGSLTTMYGTPGTGKTTLGLSFLVEGAKRGEHGVYFGFYETPPRLIEKAKSLGLDIQKYVDQGLIEIQWQAAVENLTDALAERLLERIRDKGEDKIRVFIDGMSGFRRSMAYPERFGSFLAAFSNELRTIGATTLFSEETDFFSSEPELPNRELGSVVDNVLFLRYTEISSRMHRMISILKMRESSYEPDIREYRITSSGVVIDKAFIGAEGILTGHARIAAGGRPEKTAVRKSTKSKKTVTKKKAPTRKKRLPSKSRLK